MTTYQDDGIDIDEDQDVLVQHTIVVSRDDCYSTKTWGPHGLGKNWPGQPQAVDNVLFQDVVAWTTDGAFKVGQGDNQSHSNITVDHGYVYKAHWAIFLKPDLPKSPAAAAVSNITFKNIDVESTTQTGDKKQSTWLYIELPFASLTNLALDHIEIRPAGSTAKITTADHGRIRGISFQNVVVGGKCVNGFAEMGVAPRTVNLSGATFNQQIAR